MEKKNIAIIVRALDHGGAERCASNMSIELSQHFNVHMIIFDGREQMYPHGGILHDLNILPDEGKLNKLKNIWKRSKAVAKIKRENNISCAISLLDGANIVNVHSKAEEKTIVSIRNYVSARSINFIKRWELQHYCKKADCVVALSETVGIDLIENFGVEKSKVKVIYNSVDAERLMSLSRETAVAGIDYPYIVTMGRLIKQKGHTHLLRAFKIVVDKHPEYKLVVLGQGDEEEGLKKLCKNLKIESNVVFMGYIKNPHNIIAKSQFFVLSSVFEGLGNVILEALACGKMVISTDCLAGPREILAPDTDLMRTVKGISATEYALYGVLVPAFPNEKPDFVRTAISREEEIMAQTIINMIENDKMITHYEKMAKKMIVDYFNSEKINSEWIKVISKLCFTGDVLV